MTDLLIYAGLSLLALALYRSWSKAPARWRFRLALLMLLLALVPWSQIPTFSVSTTMAPDWTKPAFEHGLSSVSNDLTTDFSSVSTRVNLELWWLSIAGAIVLVWLLSRQHLTLRRWRNCATPAPELVERVPAVLRSGAMIQLLPASRIAITTGFWRPTVWIGEQLLDDPRLNCVLGHELAHAGNNDHRWAVLITCVRCLLWWHPLVWLWSSAARREIEFSCDQQCQLAFAPQHYRRELASLLRDWAQPSAPASALGISARPGLNIQRLKRMEETAMPRPIHTLSLIAVMIMAPLIFLRPVGAGVSSIVETDQEITVAYDDVPVGIVLHSLIIDAGLDSLYIYPGLEADLGVTQ